MSRLSPATLLCVEVLQKAVGSWIGFYEGAYTITLATALRGLPGLEPWIAQDAVRRGQADHRTPEAHPGASWPRRLLQAP